MASLSLNNANSFLDETESEFVFLPNTHIPVIYSTLATFRELSPVYQKGVLNREQLPLPSRLQSYLLPSIAKEPNVSLIAQCRRSHDRDLGLALGILQRIDENVPEPQAIVFCPTDDVAHKFCDKMSSLAHCTEIQCNAFAPFYQMADHLSSGVICGTFDSLSELVLKNVIQTSKVKVLVIDELDFILLSKTPDERRSFVENSLTMLSLIAERAVTSVQLIILCSAYSDVLKTIVPRLLHCGSYNMLFANQEEREFSNVMHRKVVVNDSKIVIAEEIIKHVFGTYGNSAKVIVYINNETVPDSLHKCFSKWQVKTPKLAGKWKDKCLAEFREGFGNILITSERFPLGCDIAQPECVIFYDIPIKAGEVPSPEYSVFHHMAGRAGKANGHVVTLLKTEGDFHLLSKLETHFDFEALEIDPAMNLILPQA